MWIKSLLDLRPTKKRGRRLPLHRQRTPRLYLEQLEDRTLPSIAFVGSLGGTIAEGTATHPKSTATINVTGTPVVGGDIIVEFALHANNSTRQTGPVTVTDNAGNTYTEVVDTLGPPGGSADIRTVVLVAQDITAVPGTITVNFPSTDLAAVSAAEFTGLAAVDQTNFAVGQSTSPNSGPVTTSAPNELLIGSIGVYSLTPTSFTPGSGYTALTEETAVNSNGTLQIGEAPEYQIVSSAGQYEATGTLNPSARWADAIVTFEAALTTPTLTTTPTPASETLGASPVTLTDTADLEAGSSPTGTITFTLYNPAGTLVDTEMATVTANGTYTTPTGFTLPTTGSVTGTYQWDATYSGDSNNSMVSDVNAADEQVVVSAASPPPTGTLTLTTTPTPASLTLGTTAPTLTDTADLEGAYFPTGTITFTLYNPGGTLVDTETATVTANGTYTTPTGFTLPTTGTVTGTYQWDATYSGDSNNIAISDVNDPAEQVVVSPASSTGTPPLTITTTAGPTVVIGSGDKLSDSATLSGGYLETGTITFTLTGPGNTVVDTETATVAGNGTYTTPTGFLPTAAGTYYWVASYGGDGNNSAIASGATAEPESAKILPTLTTTPIPASLTLGTTAPTLTDTADLEGGSSPTGTITFTLYNPSGTLVDTETATVTANGTYTTPTGFTLPTTGTVTGTYQWDATYSGDANNDMVSDNNATDEQVVVSPASSTGTPPLAITTTAGPSVVIGSVDRLTDSATLSGGYFETGTITFTLTGPGNTVVDTETATVAGNGTYTTPTGFLPTATGTYYWVASYGGDSNNSAIASGATAEPEMVTVAIPSIVTTAGPTVVIGSGDKLTDSATLSGGYLETGTITFTLTGPGNTVVDTETATVAGNGTYTTPTGFLPTATGTYYWVASYGGDTNDSAIASGATAEPELVSLASPTITTVAGPSVGIGSGDRLTDSATLAGGFTETGTITFTLTGPGGTVVDTETAAVTGNGTYTTPTGFLPTAMGTYYWVASYGGDGNNNAIASGATAEPETATGGQTSPNPFPLGANTPGVGAPLVNLLQNGQLVANQNPFPGFTGQLRIATGELPNGDTIYVYGAGPAAAGGPAVKVVDETTGATLAEFFAFAPSFTGGVFVAVGDVNGDGVPDIIVGAGAGGGPEVKVIDGTKLNQVNAQGEIENTALLADFFAYAPTFTGGVSVAAADFTGNGKDDVVTGAGPGGGPEVKVIDATKLNQVNAQGEIMDSTLLADFFAYAPTFSGGVFVAAGDVNGDGVPDLITGAGAGGGPEVKVIDGTKLKDIVTSGPQMNEIMDAALLGDFFAYAPNFMGGVRVGTVEINGQIDVITGAGPTGGPEVKVVNSSQLGQVVTSGPQTGEIMDGALLDDFFATTGSDPNGVFV